MTKFRQRIETTKKLENGDILDISYDLEHRSSADYNKVKVEKGRCFIAQKVYKDKHNHNYYMDIENPAICKYNHDGKKFGILHFKNRLKYNIATKKYELIAIDLINVERF